MLALDTARTLNLFPVTAQNIPDYFKHIRLKTYFFDVFLGNWSKVDWAGTYEDIYWIKDRCFKLSSLKLSIVSKLQLCCQAFIGAILSDSLYNGTACL